jgi:TRAP-type C4-dicarboxylate transport system permease small subunit
MRTASLSEELTAPVSNVAAPLDKLLTLITEPLAAVVVVAEVLVLLIGVISRFVFNHPLTWSDELASIMFL